MIPGKSAPTLGQLVGILILVIIIVYIPVGAFFMAQPCTASLRPRIPVCSRGSNVAWLVVSLLWHRTTAQFAAQVLIEPTVDPESVLASVGTRAGPRGGLKPSGFSDGKGGRFDGPLGVAFSPDGHTYVADSRNHAIRRVGGDGEIGRAHV